MPDVPQYELADLANYIDKRCLADLARVTYRSEVRQDLVLLSLYLAIVENAHAVGVLVKAGKGRQGYQLLRSMWEASMDLELVARNEKHILNMVLVHTTFWLRQLCAGRDGNPLVESLGALPDLAEQISSRKREVEIIKAEGGRNLTIKAKCEALGWTDEYETAYATMSNYGHNNLQALISQHFEEDENKKVQLVLFSASTMGDVQLLLDTTLNILRNTSQTIHRYFDTGLATGYEQMSDP